jgi:hypothetical protein
LFSSPVTSEHGRFIAGLCYFRQHAEQSNRPTAEEQLPDAGPTQVAAGSQCAFAAMRTAHALVLISAFVCSPVTLACSPLANTPARFAPTDDPTADAIPLAANASVKSFLRAGERGGSCSDLAFLTLSIPASSTTRKLGYRFEAVTGNAPKGIFRQAAIMGREVDGELLFAFAWVDRQNDAIEMVIRVTTYSESGRKGGSTMLRVYGVPR